jgi:hypothetical protein
MISKIRIKKLGNFIKSIVIPINSSFELKIISSVSCYDRVPLWTKSIYKYNKKKQYNCNLGYHCIKYIEKDPSFSVDFF